MSRSYKKSPVFGDKANKWVKRQASKAVRRERYLDNGGAYKKCYEQWNIRDFAYALWGKTVDEIKEFTRSGRGMSK